MGQLDDRVCVVTGAASGIGRSTVLAMVGRGASVLAVDLREDPSLRDELKALAFADDGFRIVQADVIRTEDHERIVATALNAFGRIDALVNCAGVGSLLSLTEVTREEWDRVLSINLTAPFFLAQRVMRQLADQGSGTIINVASAAAKIGGVAVGAPYVASKAAVIGLTKSLALFGACSGVTANCVSPGPTVTPLTDEWGAKLNAEFAAKIPMKRYGEPAEIAEAIWFLASNGASYITGATIDVNGGLVMD